jgi:hypothetical protein
VQVHPFKAAADGSTFLPVVGGLRFDQFMPAPHRGMLIGIDDQAHTAARLFGADLREAHRKIAQSRGVPSAVVIPRAYELDDITYGIIWALISLDERGGHLIRPGRTDEPARFGKLARCRQWIEAIVGTLRAQLSLEDHGGVTLAGVCTRGRRPAARPRRRDLA